MYRRLQADLIGPEYKDPQSGQGQPRHEELYTKLIPAESTAPRAAIDLKS